MPGKPFSYLVCVVVGLMAGKAVHTAHANETLNISSGELKVVLYDRVSAPEKRAAELFVQEIERRTGLRIPMTADAAARYSLIIGTQTSSELLQNVIQQNDIAGKLEPNGFYLKTTPDERGCLFVVGNDASGVVAGIGKLLRLIRYNANAIEIPLLRLNEHPEMPVCGMYIATHFHNFYHAASLEEVDRVIEDFALWGTNGLMANFPVQDFDTLEDPKAQKKLNRLKHLAKTAQAIGMDFGLTQSINQNYRGTPNHLKAKRDPKIWQLGVEICPSIPEGLAMIGKWQAELLASFPQLDFIVCWPYDSGGCACDQCKPWGGKGFLRASEQFARLFRERFPQGEVWLSTWWFDHQHQWGDCEGLFRYIKDGKADWLTGILAGRHGDYQRLYDRPSAKRYPMVWFPEISMHMMIPWGGYGANPLPDYCHEIMQRLKGRIAGCWPYSEGIYEDLNKFLWVQFCWDPDRQIDDMLAEYATYYWGAESANDAVQLFHLLEKTHARKKGWAVDNLAEADDAFRLAQSIDKRMPAWARSDWRWRIVYLRAAIDHVLKNQGHITAQAQAALAPLFEELVQIYHAQRSFIRPPVVGNLAFRRPVEASSTHPQREGSAVFLVDGVAAEHHAEVFWAHDPNKEERPQINIDLGQVIPIGEVRLQFRNGNGRFQFVPRGLRFEVSADGETFEPAGQSTNVPAEGTPYETHFWPYKINKRGRHLRIKLGASQHTQGKDAGRVALVEVQIFGE